MPVSSNTKHVDIPDDIESLWKMADELWEEKQNLDAFYSYASANYVDVYRSLAKLRNDATTFIEFGSGLGIVTIMASRLGFDAYGIEAEEKLVDYARQYAEQYAPDAKFASGSFIPDDFEWKPADGDESIRTVIDVPAAYHQFDMELEDFDLIYAYPWPTEHPLYFNILRQFARPGAMFLTYDAREGIELAKI